MKNRNIFNDLATLSEAGISILEAARKVSASHPDIKAWDGIIKKLSSGRKLAESLGESGLISPFEKEIIAVAEHAGYTEHGLRWIANSYDKRRQRVSRLKSKLYLPFAILVIGIVVSSILTVMKNPDVSLLLVLFQAISSLIFVAVITKIILNFMEKDFSGILNKLGIFQQTIFYKHLFEQTVFGVLLWSIKAGVDFKNGFYRISKLINSKSLKEKMIMVSRFCGKGVAVTESIKKVKLPITAELEQILITAEASGRWQEVLERYLEQQMIMLDIQIDNAFEWTPRIYYIVVVMIASSIIFR